MPPLRTRSRGCWLQQSALACIAILLTASLSPPKFPRTRFTDSTVCCQAQHEHKLCFDYDNPHWLTPTGSHFLVPTASAVAVTLPYQPFIETAIRDCHYNRPPPIS